MVEYIDEVMVGLGKVEIYFVRVLWDYRFYEGLSFMKSFEVGFKV